MIRLTAAVVLALLAVFLAVPLGAQDTAGKIAHQDGNNVFTTSQDFLFRGAIPQPGRPTITSGATSGGACTSTRNYITFVSYKNITGETQISPPSYEFTPSSGSTNVLTVTRPATTTTSNINTWTAWYADDSDNYQTIRGCATSAGATSDIAIATTTASCLCGTGSDPVEPRSNSTADIYLLRAFMSPSALALAYDSAGTTTFAKDANTGCMMQYISGTLTWQVCSNRVIPPDCATVNPAPEFGAMCKNQDTGEVLIRTGAGLISLTGVAR